MDHIEVEIVDINGKDVRVKYPDGSLVWLRGALQEAMYEGQKIRVRKKNIRMASGPSSMTSPRRFGF